MKRLGYLAMATMVAGTATLFGTDIVPKRTEFAKYQAMLDHSPFAVATAAALPAATPSFAKDLYIANAARSPEGDLVTLASASDKNFKEYLSTKEPNVHGYGVANIEWSDRVGETKVTISKDGQFASVTFNQALLAAAPGGNPGGAPPGFAQPQPMPQPQMQNGHPGVTYPTMPVPTPVNAMQRPAVPSLPTPPPRVRGVIPRNPSVVTQPTPAVVATPPMPNPESDE
jgi:hypothetical protein